MFYSSLNRRVIFALSVLALIIPHSENADARMYQWSHAATGTVQLSGSPPAWYRSSARGPRVFVFDNGKLIDDSAVPVGEEHRQLLHTNAFGHIDEQSFSREDPDDSTIALRDALENASREGIDVDAITDAFAAEQATIADQAGGGAVEQTVVELKALLEAWDSRHLDEAKALLREVRGDPQ